MRKQVGSAKAALKTDNLSQSNRESIRKSGPDQMGCESPLLWLFRRKDKSGESIIGPAGFAAGERLRADLTFAGMMPRVTMNWSAAASVDRSRSGVTLNPSEATIAARQRVDLAVRAVGPEFSGLLIDLCGFCKGIETIEMERGWPLRSGKVVIRLALSALARHYGLDDIAVGRERNNSRNPILAWSTPDAKPKITNLPFAQAG
jgi:Domain of unknown function (DUF6456)